MGIVNEIKSVVDIIPNGDKIAHFLLSMIIAFAFGWLCSIFDVKVIGVIILSFLSSFGIGIGKEISILDQSRLHHCWWC